MKRNLREVTWVCTLDPKHRFEPDSPVWYDWTEAGTPSCPFDEAVVEPEGGWNKTELQNTRDITSHV